MCLSGRCSLCINAKEPKMVDLTKPLTVKGWCDFFYIGKNKHGELIVESVGGCIHRASADTFKIITMTDSKSYYLENKLEPWEEAWKQSGERAMYMMEKDYFKHVFELGRNYKGK